MLKVTIPIPDRELTDSQVPKLFSQILSHYETFFLLLLQSVLH